VKPVVIDTNVLAVAEGLADHADNDCRRTCVAFLRDVRSSGVVLVDDGRRIFGEYLRPFRHRRQPGVGWSFARWLMDGARARRQLRAIPIRPRAGDQEDYEEFPREASLAAFDPSDRKFVAVALASGLDPDIANTVDSDWAMFHSALQAVGVRIQFLCPHLCAPESGPPPRDCSA